MARVFVEADDGRRAEVVVIDEVEGLMVWRGVVESGCAHVQLDDYAAYTLSDVVNAADIHLDHQCVL
jgi:hypothetical protein